MANTPVEIMKMLEAEPSHRTYYRAAKMPFTALAKLASKLARTLADDFVGDLLRSLGYALAFATLGYLLGFIELAGLVKNYFILAGVFMAFIKLSKALR